MTTTTIWRARCRDCGLEQRRKSDPRRRTDAHNDLLCHDCVHPIEWQRYEVSEERGWRVGERTSKNTVVWADWRGHLVVGEPGSLHSTKVDAEQDAAYRRVGNPYEVVIQRVVRRTLRRVGR
jgi:hypothetical protein